MFSHIPTTTYTLIQSIGIFALFLIAAYALARRSDLLSETDTEKSNAAGVLVAGTAVFVAISYWSWGHWRSANQSAETIRFEALKVGGFLFADMGVNFSAILAVLFTMFTFVIIPISLVRIVHRATKQGVSRAVLVAAVLVAAATGISGVTQSQSYLIPPYRDCAISAADGSTDKQVMLNAVRSCVEVEDWVPYADKCARVVFNDGSWWDATINDDGPALSAAFDRSMSDALGTCRGG